MSYLVVFSLRVLHALYSAITYLFHFWLYLKHRTPQALTAHRRQIPAHLALLLFSDERYGNEEKEDVYVESVERASNWCRRVGIRELTVYDEHGILLACSQRIRVCVAIDEVLLQQEHTLAPEYPPTPPLSDCSESRSISPEPDFSDNSIVTIRTFHHEYPRMTRNGMNTLTHRGKPYERIDSRPKPFTIHIVSRAAGKPSVASVTRSLARLETLKSSKAWAYHEREEFAISTQEMNALIEVDRGLPSPDLMIVHSVSPSRYIGEPLELHGYPPWQIRLTEFHHYSYLMPPFLRDWLCRPSAGLMALEEVKLRIALDEFASAEMRLGK